MRYMLCLYLNGVRNFRVCSCTYDPGQSSALWCSLYTRPPSTPPSLRSHTFIWEICILEQKECIYGTRSIWNIHTCDGHS